MNEAPSLKSPKPTAWHVLYQVALFETDGHKAPQRIAEAEKQSLIA